MRSSSNAILEKDQRPDIEGYLFDGADGSQVIFWTCMSDGVSAEHVHDYDEYFIVVEGKYTVVIDGKHFDVGPGGEFFVPRNTPHSGRFISGTRAIYAFGGKRGVRVTDLNQITR